MKIVLCASHGAVLSLAFLCIPFLTSCRELPSYALTAEVSPDGAGVVTVDPPDGPYPAGTGLQLEARAFAGFVFHHWEGGLAGTANPASLTITGPVDVTAVFLSDSVVTHPLTAAVSPEGSGTVTANPPNGPYEEGTEVQLTATALAGFTFHHWEGDLSGTANTGSLTMTGPANVTAVFLSDALEAHTLSVTVSPAGSGTVTADPPDGPYLVGTEVQVTAAALPGFVFDHWEGDLTGNANPAVTTITELTIATAVFVPDSWAKTFGGAGLDEALSIQQTPDDGYIVAGRTSSFGAGSTDMYLVKLSPQGGREWSKTFGGSGAESATAVRLTADGGYILAGHTNSSGAGGYDFYVVKTDGSGNKQWAKTFGGTNEDFANDILVGSGGYYILGSTSSNGTDMLLTMIGLTGNILGSKTYGGAGADVGESIAWANGGGCVLAGWTSSFGAGAVDAYVLKVDSAGEMLWSNTYGGEKSDYANAVAQRSTGWGYVLAGSTTSPAPFGDDMFTALISEDGFGLWGAVGWNKEEYCRALATVSDGGYAIAGSTTSFGAGLRDVHLLKLTGSNYREWDRAFGGANNEGAEAVVMAPDGGYVLAGYTESFGAGGRDMYVVRTNVNGNAPSDPAE